MLRGATISRGMLPALARASSEIAEFVRRGGNSSLVIAFSFSTIITFCITDLGLDGLSVAPMSMLLSHLAAGST